jgi:hypothetical protein
MARTLALRPARARRGFALPARLADGRAAASGSAPFRSAIGARVAFRREGVFEGVFALPPPRFGCRAMTIPPDFAEASTATVGAP